MLPNSIGGSDLDIWVHSENYCDLIRILNGVAIETGLKMMSYIPSETCPKLCFMSLTEGIQIDIFKGDIFCKYGRLVSESVIQEYLREYNGVYVLDSDAAHLISFLKEIINNGRCEEKYIAPILERADTYTLGFLNHVIGFESPAFVKDLIQLIQDRSNSQEEIVELSKLARRSLIRESILTNYRKLFRLKCTPGYAIAVMGTDGSGKSTIINGIAPILNEAFHDGVYYHHLRPHWLSDLGVMIGRREELIHESVCSEPHSSKPSGFLGSLVRWGYYLIDYSFGYLRKIWFSRHTKSHVHIFDRYYYDYYIDPYRLRVKIPKWIIRLGELLVPSPDIILCLGGNPDIIYKRKPETSLEEVTLQNERLKQFCNKRKNAVWIDTTQEIEKSVNDAMKAVHEMMAKRFENVSVK